MRFWDSSGLVPLLVREIATDDMLLLSNQDDRMVVWWTTKVECISAVARRARDGTLDQAGEVIARELLDIVAARWTEVEPTQGVRFTAARLLANHTLRAADALQLGAALIWSASSPAGHTFVCLDRRLREAARREGFALLPDSNPAIR